MSGVRYYSGLIRYLVFDNDGDELMSNTGTEQKYLKQNYCAYFFHR